MPEESDSPRVARGGRRPKLEGILRNQRDRYAKMLQCVRHGAYAHVAASVLDIQPDTFGRWFSRGRKEYEGGKDSVYARFYQDVAQAIAQASVDVEIRLAESDPKTWLKCGPRKMLGNDWQENAEVSLLIQGQVEHGRDQAHSNAGYALDERTFGQVLIEMRNAGLIEFTEATEQLLQMEGQQRRIEQGD